MRLPIAWAELRTGAAGGGVGIHVDGAIPGADGFPGSRDRRAAARRLLAAGSDHPGLDRIAALAARLLGVRSAQVSLLTEVQTIAAAAGLPEGAIGSSGPLGDSLCTVTAAAAAPLVVVDAAADGRVRTLPPVTSGQVGAYLGVPLSSSGGEIVGALCVFDVAPRTWSDADVSVLEALAESVQAELELSALVREHDLTSARLDLAAQAGDIGMFEWDLVTGDLEWDDRLIAMYGYDSGDVGFDRSIESVNARLHPDDAQRVGDTMAASIAAVGPLQVLYRIVLPGGRTRWLEARGRALPGPDGSAARLMGLSWDVTDQQEAEARADRVLASMSIGFLALDRDWRITYVNDHGEQLLGAPAGVMVGAVIWELFPATVGTEFERAYREVAASGIAQTLEAFYPAPLAAWYEIRVAPTPDGIALYFTDITARRDSEQLLQLSVDVSGHMVGAVSVDDAVEAVARLLVPRLADWTIVSLVEPEGQIRDVRTWHRDPALRSAVERYAQHRWEEGGTGVVTRAVAAREPVRVDQDALQLGLAALSSPPARAALTELDVASAVVVPMITGGVVVGVLTLGRGPGRPPITAQELGVAVSTCRRAGLAIDNSRLHAAQAAAAEHDRSVAQALQQALLTRLPEPDHVHLVARYLTAADRDQVGGDWYDAVLAPGGATTVMIGDVMGHDIAAAAVMGQLRTMLRIFALEHEEPPAQILTRLDHAARSLHVDTMASVLTARIEQTADERRRGVRTLRWSNAGHPPPVLLLPGGEVDLLTTDAHDILVGVAPDLPRHDHVRELPVGSTLILYTDGLVETRGDDLEHGFERLRAVLRRHHDAEPGAMLDAVLADMVGEHPADDVAVLAVRLHPEDAPRPAEAGPGHI